MLDRGCDTGIFLKKLTEKFSKVYGVDISMDMLQKINEKSEHVKGTLVGDGMNLPFLANSFDCVVCRGVLHHLPDLHNALVEIQQGA